MKLKISFSFIVPLGFVFSFFSCSGKLLKIIKSSNMQEIFQKAMEFEKAKKDEEALELYDHLISIGVDSSLKKEIDYKKAWINYRQENYILSAHLFKNFHKAYLSDQEKAQEALFRSAYCYFLLSADYNLDQKETYKAIEELQVFINYYPDSQKLKEANNLIRQLEIKLEKKAFYLAKNYYDNNKYKEVVLSFGNFLADFPMSIFKEEAFFYRLISQIEFAAISLEEFKEERKIKALSFYEEFKNRYPNSIFLKKSLLNKLEKI